MQPASLIQLGPANQPGLFLRIEDKFILPQALKNEFFEVLKTRMAVIKFGTSSDANTNESIYFDSNELDFFKHHFTPMQERFKVRVRTYNPEIVDNISYLEAKCKQMTGLDAVTIKKRFKIDPQNYERIKNGQQLELSREIRELNAEIKPSELSDRIALIRTLAGRYFITPQIKVRYNRVSFESENIRVTVDENLAYQKLHNFAQDQADKIKSTPMWTTAKAIASQWSRQDQMLIEVKHGGQIPKFIQSFLEQNNISKVSFSKYCWAVAEGLEKE